MTRIEVMTIRSLAAVKAHFSQVIDEVAGTHERVTVTKNGSPVAVILAVEDYESLMETLEILSDPRAGTEIRRAEEEMAAGKVFDEADVRAALAARRRGLVRTPTPSSSRQRPSGPSSETCPSRWPWRSSTSCTGRSPRTRTASASRCASSSRATGPRGEASTA